MSKELAIGVDLDGVLAEFNEAYKDLLTLIRGERLIPALEDPPVWGYDKHYGHTKEEINEAWERIKKDPTFWAYLKPRIGAREALNELAAMRLSGVEVYFITTRMGESCHLQSVYFLTANGHPQPTVLIARGNKGDLAAGLGLTHFLDDKPENCADVLRNSPDTKAYILDHNYNRHFDVVNLQRVFTVNEFLQEVYNDAQSRKRQAVS